ncbi:MAG TPA: hypothetical protein VNA27_16385 [Rubrobacteraceae bacterium]|jgi:hypothetical protein|nr:hypothetical protein [Rubrobacteraceae bacterium]HZG61954.1 hypothetical protein [Rubrobacteraceae bacterium]
MEGIRRRREFEQAIRDVVARLKREGKDRIERTHVEEVGERYDLKPEEARDLFVDSKGEVWKGEFVESAEEPGWEAVKLESVPSSAPNTPDDLSV